ncbi:MAG: vWA domain-containing protein [Isosphaeraceae bacterium]
MEAISAWLERANLHMPALGASVLLHLSLLAVLAMLATAVQTDTSRALESEMVIGDLPDLSKLDSTELIETDRTTTIEEVGGTFAPRLSPTISQPPVDESPKLAVDVPSATRAVLPAAARLDTVMTVRGTGMENVEGVDKAVDRLAQEVLRRLEQGRTLVVWAFDASGSLQSEREKIRKHIEEVYNHIGQAGSSGSFETSGLRTAVVGFGQDRKILAEPTEDPSAVSSAIASVGLDESGIETTFQTVIDIVKRYGKYKVENQPTRMMIVVVTDEIGDDPDKLEPAIKACNGAQVPVFVLGSPAVFGRKDGLADYKDPRTGKQYYNLKVDQGPESALLEGVQLPFWFEGPQYEYLDSGFGPYALSRLCASTQGIYFISRMSNKVPIHYDPAGMQEYRPDWMPIDHYRKAVMSDPIRQAVVMASEICQKQLPRSPRLSFPPADDPGFKDDLTRVQEGTAVTLYTVDEALLPINQVAKVRDKEPSRRWLAHYDLIRGRLLALKVRCSEYTGQCAKMKRDTPKFTKANSNAWRLVPDAEIHYSDKAAAAAKEAETILRRVIADHPGTPWATLAQRELQHPMGLKWVETYVPPPPKPNENAAAAAAKKAQMKAQMKPEEPPKL